MGADGAGAACGGVRDLGRLGLDDGVEGPGDDAKGAMGGGARAASSSSEIGTVALRFDDAGAGSFAGTVAFGTGPKAGGGGAASFAGTVTFGTGPEAGVGGFCSTWGAE